MRFFLLGLWMIGALFPLPVRAGNLTVTVSIPPQKYIVDKISGGTAMVNVLVDKGADPHTFSPKMSQAALMSESALYLGIGFPFEKTALSALAKSYRNLKIVDTSAGIELLPEGEDHFPHEHGGMDPHMWMSPRPMLIIMKNTYQALAEADPAHAGMYRANLEALTAEVRALDGRFTVLFADEKTAKKFLIYHPFLGYFASDYGLQQYAVEREGKPPKAKQLQNILKIAESSRIRIFFVNPQHSQEAAVKIAASLGIQIVSVDILAEKWMDTMNQIYGVFAATAE